MPLQKAKEADRANGGRKAGRMTAFKSKGSTRLSSEAAKKWAEKIKGEPVPPKDGKNGKVKSK